MSLAEQNRVKGRARLWRGNLTTWGGREERCVRGTPLFFNLYLQNPALEPQAFSEMATPYLSRRSSRLGVTLEAPASVHIAYGQVPPVVFFVSSGVIQT